MSCTIVQYKSIKQVKEHSVLHNCTAQEYHRQTYTLYCTSGESQWAFLSKFVKIQMHHHVLQMCCTMYYNPKCIANVSHNVSDTQMHRDVLQMYYRYISQCITIQNLLQIYCKCNAQCITQMYCRCIAQCITNVLKYVKTDVHKCTA